MTDIVWRDFRSGEAIPVTPEQHSALIEQCQRYGPTIKLSYSHLMKCVFIHLPNILLGVEENGYVHS
jgi:hypothetical protein